MTRMVAGTIKTKSTTTTEEKKEKKERKNTKKNTSRVLASTDYKAELLLDYHR